MAKFSLESLMRRLSVIPGFRFLEAWVSEYHMTHTRVGQRVGDLQTYYRAAKGGVGDVAEAVGGASPEALDPNLDSSGNAVPDEEDSGFGMHAPRNQSYDADHSQVDGLSQNYEDVFFDDD